MAAPDTPPDRRSERTRAAALAAFAGLLMERGYDAVSVAGVAERAGVGRSTLYEHFRTKDALLAASLERPLAPLAAHPPDLAALCGLLEHVRANTGAVRALLVQPMRSRVARVLAARIGARLRAGGTAPALADLRAVGAAEAQLALIALWLAGGTPASPQDGARAGALGALGVSAVAAELARVARGADGA